MRETYDARLVRKTLLSQAAECYHFEFAFEGPAPDAMQPGQFLSLLAEGAAGKTYTRAYSIASASYTDGEGKPMFDLCINRVQGGFFSNLLCDMHPGDAIRCHGPHGLFTLRQPDADGLWVAAGTGIAPMRGFAQWLFPSDATADRTGGRQHWLLYQAPSAEELFYNSYFEQLAARHANFHYLPVVAEGAYPSQMEEALARAAAVAGPNPGAAALPDPAGADGYGYVCGLSELVKPARAQLLALGWPKPRILFERYD